MIPHSYYLHDIIIKLKKKNKHFLLKQFDYIFFHIVTNKYTNDLLNDLIQEKNKNNLNSRQKTKLCFYF